MNEIPNIHSEKSETFEDFHAKVKAVLGKSYSEKKLDAIVGGVGDAKIILAEMDVIAGSKNEIERMRAIKDWYAKHQEWLDLFGVTD